MPATERPMHPPAEDPACPSHPPLPGGGWPLLGLLAAIQFTHIVDFMILMPLGPRYQTEMHLSAQEFSLLVFAYACSAAVSGLLAATIIDRFDRKHALLSLYTGFTVGTF